MRIAKLISFALAITFIAANNASAANQPNIILIMADDLGRGELGCYGQQKIKTPRIDELAAEGLRFTQFYAGSPVCAPSRCTLMTGKHTGNAAIRDNREKGPWTALAQKYEPVFTGQEPLPDDEVTIAELLKARGYATAAIGKWGLGHFGTSGDPNKQGFDLFYGYNCQRHAHNHYPAFLWRNDQKEPLPGNDGKNATGTHSQKKFTEEALKFIHEHKEGPFFLYLPYIIPHLAIQPPKSALDHYAGQFPEADHDDKSHYIKHPTPRAGYAAMVSYLDSEVGKIVDLVDELGLDKNTLILFTSDNGPTYERAGGADSTYFNSTAGLRGRKTEVYEGGIRVPMIARWTGKVASGGTIDSPGALWDLLPTLSELAGAAPPIDGDGVSLLDLIVEAKPLPPREYFYWEYPTHGGQQAVRWGDWKGVRTKLFEGPQPWQLYDLAADEQEVFDVAAEHPDVVARIDEAARESHVGSKQFPFPQLDAKSETQAKQPPAN